MFGIEAFFIHQDRQGKRYYFKGSKKDGRRIWTDNQNRAHFYTDKKEAIKSWEDMGRIGEITDCYL